MALSLSTPVEQLAWETANRNAEAQAAAEKYIADRTAMQAASRLIAPMGGNAEDYASELGAADAAARRRAKMAELYKNYVIGMPEDLAGAAAEARASRSSGGGGSSMGSATLPFDPIAVAQYLFGLNAPAKPVPTPTSNKPAPTAQPVRAVPLRYGRLGVAGRS